MDTYRVGEEALHDGAKLFEQHYARDRALLSIGSSVNGGDVLRNS